MTETSSYFKALETSQFYEVSTDSLGTFWFNLDLSKKKAITNSLYTKAHDLNGSDTEVGDGNHSNAGAREVRDQRDARDSRDARDLGNSQTQRKYKNR